MSHVEHKALINVPVEDVFAALLRVEDAPKWMVGLETVTNVTGHGQGDSFDWTFKMAGTLSFRGKTVLAVVQPSSYLREDGSGEMTNTMHWRLAPEGSGTRLHVRVDYVVPGGAVLGGILDKIFVERQNQKDIEQSVANLKRLLKG